jgi:hypothetical protein
MFLFFLLRASRRIQKKGEQPDLRWPFANRLRQARLVVNAFESSGVGRVCRRTRRVRMGIAKKQNASRCGLRELMAEIDDDPTSHRTFGSD